LAKILPLPATSPVFHLSLVIPYPETKLKEGSATIGIDCAERASSLRYSRCLSTMMEEIPCAVERRSRRGKYQAAPFFGGLSMFEPWKGKHYSTTRLLLLGESTYSSNKVGESVDPMPRRSIDIVEWQIQSFPKTKGLPKALSRAICNDKSPSPERLAYCWDRVAFTNYVPAAVVNVKNRPTREMWQQAKKEFPQILKCLHPKRIIVLGKTAWANMPETADCFDKEGNVQTYRLTSGELCYCWAMVNRGLAWRTLSSIIHFACGDAFIGPK
jgi:hypothetical protein